MLFKSVIASFIAMLTLAQGIYASTDVTSKQVVGAFTTVTKASASINVAFSGVSTGMSFTQIQTVVTTVTTGFTAIITDVGSATTMLQNAHPLGPDDSDLVVNALLLFVKVHQDLLATVIAKHGILSQFFLGAPVAGVLRTLEAGVDAFAIVLIALIPSKGNEASAAFAKLKVSVESSITTYNQLCIPSLTYPTTMPICINL
ncbi:hypothetical protein BDN70DRAFT_918513 [Pholiota conissans]|uniref:Uncharacterized protein n=1 Tax=Pholiota conissans TaxID=109636 RepID=A0A9P6CXT5_9AGAR|nr:hypothetical protein BDN70DRAFT_918513 [Pholiota conissans]